MGKLKKTGTNTYNAASLGKMRGSFVEAWERAKAAFYLPAPVSPNVGVMCMIMEPWGFLKLP